MAKKRRHETDCESLAIDWEAFLERAFELGRRKKGRRAEPERRMAQSVASVIKSNFEADDSTLKAFLQNNPEWKRRLREWIETTAWDAVVPTCSVEPSSHFS